MQTRSVAALTIGVWVLAIILFGVWLSTGNASSKKRRATLPSVQKKADGMVVMDAAKLPETEDGPPPLDEGHLVVRTPKKWSMSPRSAERLFRTREKRGVKYPAITITHYPVDADGVQTLDAENVKTFAAQLQKELEANQVELRRNVLPLKIELPSGKSIHVVDYVRSAIVNDQRIDHLVIIRIEQGHGYQVDLQSVGIMLPRYRLHAYAVASTMEISASGADISSETGFSFGQESP